MNDSKVGQRANSSQSSEQANQVAVKGNRGVSQANGGGGGSDASGAVRVTGPKGVNTDVWTSNGPSKKSQEAATKTDMTDSASKTNGVKNTPVSRQATQETDLTNSKQPSNKSSLATVEGQTVTTDRSVKHTLQSVQPTSKESNDTTVKSATTPVKPHSNSSSENAIYIENNRIPSRVSPIENSGTKSAPAVKVATPESRVASSGNTGTGSGSQGFTPRAEMNIATPVQKDTKVQDFSGVSGSRSNATEIKSVMADLNAVIEKALSNMPMPRPTFPQPGDRFVGPALKEKVAKIQAYAIAEDAEAAQKIGTKLSLFTHSDNKHVVASVASPKAMQLTPQEISSMPIVPGTRLDEVLSMLSDFCIDEEAETEDQSNTMATSTATAAPTTQKPTTYVTKIGDTLNSIALIAYGKPLHQLTPLQQQEIRNNVPVVSLQEKQSDPALLKVLPAQSIFLKAA